MFFQLVSILFAIVPDYGNEYTRKENKNWTSFKNFAPKLNLNHNIYIQDYRCHGVNFCEFMQEKQFYFKSITHL